MCQASQEGCIIMNYYLMQRQCEETTPFTIPLNEQEVVIGRQNVTFLRKFIQISKRHATLYREADRWFVKDLGSLNGTFVNGKRVVNSSCPLKIGDIIGFGVCELLDTEGFVCIFCAYPRLKLVKTEVIDISDDDDEEAEKQIAHEAIPVSTKDTGQTDRPSIKHNSTADNFETPQNKLNNDTKSNLDKIAAEHLEAQDSEHQMDIPKDNSKTDKIVKTKTDNSTVNYKKSLATPTETLNSGAKRGIDVEQSHRAKSKSKIVLERQDISLKPLKIDLQKCDSPSFSWPSNTKKYPECGSFQNRESKKMLPNAEITNSEDELDFMDKNKSKIISKAATTSFNAGVQTDKNAINSSAFCYVRIERLDRFGVNFTGVDHVKQNKFEEISSTSHCNEVRDKPVIEPMEQSDEEDTGFEFSQREEIITISDDDDYLDFKSSQVNNDLAVPFIKSEPNFESEDDFQNFSPISDGKNDSVQTTIQTINISEATTTLMNKKIENQNCNVDVIVENGFNENKTNNQTSVFDNVEDYFPDLSQNFYNDRPKKLSTSSSAIANNSDNAKTHVKLCTGKIESVKAQPKGKILLTDAKPMTYRPRSTRGREEWFDEQTKVLEKTKTSPDLQAIRKKGGSRNKRKNHSLGFKSPAKKRVHKNKQNSDYELNLNAHKESCNELTASMGTRELCSRNEQSQAVDVGNHKISNIETTMKKKSTVKKRPENFCSRMNFLTFDSTVILKKIPKIAKLSEKNKQNLTQLSFKNSAEAVLHESLNVNASRNCNKIIDSFAFKMPTSHPISSIKPDIPRVAISKMMDYISPINSLSAASTTNNISSVPSVPKKQCVIPNVIRDPRLRKHAESRGVTLNTAEIQGSHILPSSKMPYYDTPKHVTRHEPSDRKDLHRHGSHQKLTVKVSFMYMVSKIVFWVPVWLNQQLTASEPPPVVSKGAGPIALSFKSLDNYVSSFFPMLLLDVWETLFQEWKKICTDGEGHMISNKFYFIVTSFKNEEYLMEMKCECLVNSSSAIPSEGHVAVIDLRQNDNVMRVFGYIKRDKCEGCPEKLNPQFRALPEKWQKNAKLYRFSFCTKKRPFEMEKACLMKAHLLSYVKNKLRLADALRYIENSPLSRDILNPRKETVQVPRVLEKRNISRSFNQAQTDVILSVGKLLLKDREPRIVLIQGPPGTGKTHTTVGLINHLLEVKRKNKILVVAPSNAAVDEIGRRLVQSTMSAKLTNKVQFVRVGQNKQIHPELVAYSLDKLALNLYKKQCEADCKSHEATLLKLKAEIYAFSEQMKNSPHNSNLEKKCRACIKRYDFLKNLQEKLTVNPWNFASEKGAKSNVLKNANVVLSTLSSCRQTLVETVFGEKEEDSGFSYCIIDEATQCTEPEVLQPLMYGIRKLILIGDHQQLPATVNSQLATKYNFDRSLYERFHLYFSNQDSPIVMLDEQFRMHSEICTFPSRYFYSNRLRTSAGTDRKYGKFPLRPYTVFDIIDGQETSAKSSKTNLPEAKIISCICEEILRCIPLDCSIGVVTPYQGQRELYIRSFSHNQDNRIEFNTVDSFQGREKDIIIVSCVRANSSSGGIGFLACKKRLNVAITRAKQCLIICGHMSSLRNDDNWTALISDAKSRSVYVTITSPEDVPIVMNEMIKI